MLQLLVEAGTHINQPGSAGYTPLHYALHYGHLPVIEYLLERKASLVLSDQSGNVAVHMAAKGKANERESASTSRFLLVLMILMLLLLLIRDAAGGSVAVLQFLYERKAVPSIDIQNNNTDTPLRCVL